MQSSHFYDLCNQISFFSSLLFKIYTHTHLLSSSLSLPPPLSLSLSLILYACICNFFFHFFIFFMSSIKSVSWKNVSFFFSVFHTLKMMKWMWNINMCAMLFVRLKSDRERERKTHFLFNPKFKHANSSKDFKRMWKKRHETKCYGKRKANHWNKEEKKIKVF